MYLKIQAKKIPIKEYLSLKMRFVSLKFYLMPLDFVLFFPRKKLLNTTFFCQRVDVCFTDLENRILYLHENVKSEIRIYHPKAKQFYILPIGSCKHLKVGETLNILQK